MENSNIKGICKLDACLISKGGTCLEGFPNLQSCPNYVIQDDIKPNEDISKETINLMESTNALPVSLSTGIIGKDAYENLYQGEGLSPELALSITSKYLTRLIMVAGGSNSGKTTLLTSIYEKFQMGGFAGYIFAGSRTLRAWESRCHLARIESGRSTSDTERTKLADGTLLHLAVRDQINRDPIRHIIFTDLGGELFKLVKDSIKECQNLTLLKRVDHFVLLIDGNQLINLKERNNAFTDARVLLRTCLDSQMLGKNTFVEIVFTKWDLINKYIKSNKNGITEFLEVVENRFRSEFEDRVNHLQFFRIAARPEKNELPFGYNLDQLFPKWVDELLSKAFYNPLENKSPKYTREFDKYTFGK